MPKTLFKTLGYAAFLAAGLGIGYCAAMVPRWLTPSYQQGDFSAYYPDPAVRVVLYGTDWCRYCKETRAFLQSRGIRYLDLDVEKSPVAARQFQQLGGQGYPLVLIGDRKFQGFEPSAFAEALQRLSG
ncbi:glutaredoxin family protein [Chitinimonas lacunae]|uniref:Glutaredoxin family protein n=1 Tax=Chitinimonas lacunae TaxID=1963018 RepID=A0ABV8MQB2_9NEIS